MVPFAQFKECENTHGGVRLLLLAEACNFTKSNSFLWVLFSRFLNCANGTKLHQTSQIDISFAVWLHARTMYYWHRLSTNSAAGEVPI